MGGPRLRRDYDRATTLPAGGMEVVSLDPNDQLQVARSRRPQKALASWGLTGRYVKVSSPAPFAFARLRFALTARNIRHIFNGTIAVVRWDSKSDRFRLVPASGYEKDGCYAFAQITQSGVYTAVGLPRDPRVLVLLRLMSALLPQAESAVRNETSPSRPLLELLRRQRNIRAIAKDATLLNALGYAGEDLTGPVDPLEAFELDDGDLASLTARLPEFDLMELTGGPMRVIKPIPEPRLPDEWPTPPGQWECLGPANVPGRIKSLAIDPRDGRVLYAGAAGGGVWKSTDGSRSWFPTMSNERSLAIGGLGIAPSNPDVLYAATGEWTGNDERPVTPSGAGGGVYRSSDGARRWHLCNGIESIMCMSVAVHPQDADCVFVGGNRGLHHSVDGGLTWRTIRNVEDADALPVGPVTSVVFIHDFPKVIFAGVHRRGIFRSNDGGKRWRLLDGGSTGLPIGDAANAPKIGVGRRGRRGSNFVSVKMGDDVYVSDDLGRSFNFLADMDDRASSMMPWCNLVAVHPENDSLIFAGGTNLHRTDDGGATWTKVAGYGTRVHEDQQFIVFDPSDGDRAYLANDGGVWLSKDCGRNWKLASRGILAAQAYDIDVSDGPVLRCGASLHDASAHIFDGRDDWISLGWGEGGYVKFVPGCPDEVYADSQWSNLMRFRRSEGGTWEAVENGPDTAPGCRRPIAVSRTKSLRVLAIDADGRSIVRQTHDSPGLWPVTLSLADATFTAVAVDDTDHRFAYAGDTKGRIWQSRDEGKSWAELWQAPHSRASISDLVVSRRNARRIYVAVASSAGPTVYRGDLDGDTCPMIELPGFGLEASSGQPGVEGGIAIAEGRYDDCLIAVQRNYVGFSTDGGMTWQPLTQSATKRDEKWPSRYERPIGHAI